MIFHQPENSLSDHNYNAYTYSGLDYAPHFHRNMELILVLEGTLSVTVNGRCQQARRGEMVLILSNQIHAFSVGDDARIWVAVFSEDHVSTFSAAIKGRQGRGAVFAPSSSVKKLVEDNLVNADSPVLMKKACFYAVCDEYLRSVALEQRQDKTSFLVGKLLDWVSEHYTEDISLKQAAQQLGYEYHYLSRLLNRSYDIRFTELLSSYRVEHARQLLEATDMSVSEVAWRSGFQSLRSFSLVFRDRTGCSPTQYRGARQH